MTQLQSDFEDLSLYNSMIIDDEEDNENINNTEDVDFPEYNKMNKEKRKKGKALGGWAEWLRRVLPRRKASCSNPGVD
ncbi:hypothetical protein INT46_005258, partial [Mucor plumbeus]